MNELLEQQRDGIEALINQDAEVATVSRKEMADNGRGQLIPSNTVIEHKVMCRVTYQSGAVWKGAQWAGGLTIDETPMVLASYDSDLKTGDTLTWRGRTYTVGTVTRPEYDGGVVCTQAPLTEVKDVS